MTPTITRLRHGAMTVAAAAAVAAFAAPAHADDFYAGKTVDLAIGANPGGGYDSYARLTARFLPEHIPGHPEIVAHNRPGAGSRKALHWLLDQADRDGTVIGAVYPGAIVDPLLRPDRSHYDVTKLNMLGSVNKTVRVCVARKDAKVQKFTDLYTTPLTIGATARGGSTRDYAVVMNNVMGTKFNVVSGYKGSKGILLSIERGETQGLCGYSYSSLTKAKPKWAQGKFVNILVQFAMTPKASVGAPGIFEFTKTDKAHDMMEFIVKQQEFGRPYVMPPEVPADRVAIMRKAVQETWSDPKFLAAAEKSRLSVDPITGEQMEKYVHEIYATPKSLIEELVAATKVHS